MTEQIVAAMDTPQYRYGGLTHAVNYAIGAMVAHRTANGASAYAGIDVEDLFSAVQMLAERESLEIAPFVEWSPALAGVRQGSGRMPPFFDRDLRRAVLEERASRGPSRLIQEAIRSVAGTDAASTEKLYEQLSEALLKALTALVDVHDKTVDYLRPLLERGEHPTEIFSESDTVIDLDALDRQATPNDR